MQTLIFPHLCECYCRALICVYIILTPQFLLLPPLVSPAYTIRFCDLFLMTISCPSKLHCPLPETLKCTDHVTLISSGRLYTVKMGAQQESLSEFHCCLYVRPFVPVCVYLVWTWIFLWFFFVCSDCLPVTNQKIVCLLGKAWFMMSVLPHESDCGSQLCLLCWALYIFNIFLHHFQSLSTSCTSIQSFPIPCPIWYPSLCL